MIFILLGILGFIFSIMGIIGYFNELSILIIVAAVYVVLEAVIGLYTGELRSISTYIIAVVVGYCVSAFTKSDTLLTIAVALCFEELVMGIVAVVVFMAVGIAKANK